MPSFTRGRTEVVAHREHYERAVQRDASDEELAFIASEYWRKYRRLPWYHRTFDRVRWTTMRAWTTVRRVLSE